MTVERQEYGIRVDIELVREGGRVGVTKKRDAWLDTEVPVAVFGHQCDEWVVGDYEDVVDLIGELQEAARILLRLGKEQG